jgi:branched-chain amino acid transport system substrate-binding protein
MKIKLLSILVGVGLALSSTQPALAQTQAQPVKFALCFDLSKAYTALTPQMSQAAHDYAKILNQKGGLEGHPIELLLQDHGNEPQRGIECYEKMKREGAIAFDFISTPVARAVLPRAMKDGNVMMSAMVGRSDTIDGEVFKWIFPIGPTYWGQAANDIHYIKTQSNNNLKGVKVAFLYIDTPFGQEPIPVLKTLAEREGFELQLFPYSPPGNEQSATWTQIRRFNPDWIMNWGLGNMHVVASREMKRNGIPMDKYIAVNWFNEVDIANIGADAAKGIKRSTSVVGGQEHPLMQQIIKDLYEKGKGSGDRKHLNDIFYNSGLAMYSPIYEGARLAIKQYGWPLTPDKMRRGLESLRNFDANGLMAPLTVTAKDHGGGGKTRIDMWDGSKWVPQTDWFSAYDDVVWEIAKKGSAEFAKSNP